MEYYAERLCLEYNELVPTIISKDLYDQLKFRNKITVHGLGGNGRKVMVELESLPDKYGAMVREIYGDPYKLAGHQALLNAIRWNADAEKYYLGYVLPNGAKLPATDKNLNGAKQINYVRRYTEQVNWLDMLVSLTADKRTLKKELNIPIMAFWDMACSLVKLKGVSLPANAKRLKEKVKDWANPRTGHGDVRVMQWESLIEKHKFGNSNSAKVRDEEAEALLKELLASRNKHDDTVICAIYNKWADETGRPQIVAQTVGYRRKMWATELMVEREGVGKTATLLSKQIQRNRASAPMLFVNSDDNVLDVYFVAGENKWYRPTLYVVIDTYNDYILGYAWGDTVTKELIKEAYRNAHRHVMELTGGAYCWQQIQTDRWGISGKNTTELEEFYNAMGVFTPAALKNAQSKYIERSFGTTWHQHLKLIFQDNYSGHNIGAKQQLNRESLDTRNFPDIREASKMIEYFINSLRAPKQQQWLEAFRSSEKAQAKLLSTEQRLQIFGVSHDYTNRITAAGISPTLRLATGETVKLTYELSQEQIFRHVGKEVKVIYDPHDLGEVLVTDGRGLRFVAHQYGRVPAAFADYEEGDSDRIKALQAEKRTLLPMVNSFIGERKAILQRARIDAESRIKAGVMVKEIAHQDQRLLQGGDITISPPTEGEFDTENSLEERGVYAEMETNEPFKKPLKPFKPVQNSIYDLM